MTYEEKTMAGNTPQFNVLTPVTRKGKTFWYRIGAGWEKVTDGKSMVSCSIDLPVQGGRIILIANPKAVDPDAKNKDEPIVNAEFDDLPF